MPHIAIPKVRDDRGPVEYRIKLDPKTNDDLLLYRELYQRTYGQRIDAKDLLEPIIRRFLDNDRGFRKFKKQQSGPSTPPPAPSPAHHREP